MTEETAEPGQRASRAVIVFDVNETLLDFAILAPVFDRVFGRSGMVRPWFNQTVLYCEALTLAGDYVDAGTVGLAVLDMMAEIEGRSVAAADLDELKQRSRAMPTYGDTAPALAALRAAGFRLVTLSNNPTAAVEAQLASAGLRGFFDELHSIDDQVPAATSRRGKATSPSLRPSASPPRISGSSHVTLSTRSARPRRASERRSCCGPATRRSA